MAAVWLDEPLMLTCTELGSIPNSLSACDKASDSSLSNDEESTAGELALLEAGADMGLASVSLTERSIMRCSASA